MAADPRRTASPVPAPDVLELALEQSHEVKAKVEACAEDLAAINDDVRREIAEGVTTLPAERALDEGQLVEARVQECAEDLHEVTDILAHGIEEIKKIESALVRSRAALEETEIALAAAQDEERQATLRALHDAATGLPNRDLFDDRVAHGISLAERHGWVLAVMFLDLDRFKSINDEHGHAAGDAVLKEVAKRLARHTRDEDTICRSGGDEFLYLMMDPRTRADVEAKARDVLRDVALPIVVDGVEVVVRPSIGIALYPDHGTSGEQLVRNADTAMYQAKKRECGLVLFGSDAHRRATATTVNSR